ncbi:hypothetical protein GCM10007049_22450 [Echinicola pacifica]|uniref:GIY-YIG domain-containing protein n=1 Tax=Echinicola pacifica TaxID=346377 RepID=A0A918Q2Y0_9BACT|nr:GIY-YIG nuclease family protein [Echinicola pacifica]GGZ28896.1 hypothetical protein GCM10007049_22450 [Echinicola pacifica]
MYYVYIIYSDITDRYYIGSCKDLELRIKHHNLSLTPSTKGGAPNWIIKYVETLENRSEALKREILIKKKKSRKYICWLINNTPFE